MFKQIGPNLWSMEPPSFPKELNVKSKTVLRMAEIGFVYQGFDGNFHYFIHRYSINDRKPTTNYHCFEELLVYRTSKSVLIGYADSFYSNGICSYHRFTCGSVKGGAGFLLFELELKELQNLENQLLENQEDEIKELPKPTGVIHAMGIQAERNSVKKKYKRIGQFFELADLDDFK